MEVSFIKICKKEDIMVIDCKVNDQKKLSNIYVTHVRIFNPKN